MSEAETIRVALCDLNGIARGKRVPASYLDKLDSGSVRMPLTALNVDISGCDSDQSPLLWEDGDADGTLLPTERGPVPMPWLERSSQLVQMTMHKAGSPYPLDPRQALASVLARYADRGWSVIAATELEFYLLDPDFTQGPKPALPPGHVGPRPHEAVLSLAELDAFDAFFSDLYEGASAMNIPAQAAISEGGTGQFEINLAHGDAMRAADDAWLFKMLVKGMARKHGMLASFLAKPFADMAGNGMHVHFSVVDETGRNVFDDGTDKGSEELRHAVAGCLSAMVASTLIFAPHGPSYERFIEGAHAPVNVAWGYENRTAAIRIPGGPASARRIEHRVAAGCTNPYLLLAAILGAAMDGIENKLTPPNPVQGNCYDLKAEKLHQDWSSAIAGFEHSPQIASIFAPELVREFTLTKKQELAQFGAFQGFDKFALYLESV